MLFSRPLKYRVQHRFVQVSNGSTNTSKVVMHVLILPFKHITILNYECMVNIWYGHGMAMVWSRYGH